VFSNAGQNEDGINVIFGNSVERIPAYMFYTGNYPGYVKPKITSVTIGNNVKSIGVSAFDNCTEITNITIPSNVESIGFSAFYNCKSLSQINWDAKNCADFIDEYNYYYENTGVFSFAGQNGDGISVIFGDTVEKIPSYIFYTSGEASTPKISSITIGNSVKSIGPSAFNKCTELASITIGSNVKSIGGSAFRNCTGLTSINITDSVESIGKSAFVNCTGLTSITIGNNVESIGSAAFCGCESLSEINWNAKNCADFTEYDRIFLHEDQKGDGISVIFGDMVKKIPSYLFYYDSSKIKNVIIGNNVESIGNSAFYNCTGITSLNIPDSVKSIGGRAFYNCTELENLTIGNSVESVDYDAFYNCKSLSLINWNAKNCADFRIGNYVKEIFYNAGQNRDGINVTFGDNVEKIPAYMFFDGNPKIKNIVIGNNVKTIGRCAFYNCIGITSLNIPDSVKSIGSSAFYNCTELENITIGNNVESIGGDAFCGCTSLSQINWNAKSCADFTDIDRIFWYAGQKGDVSVIFGDTVEKIPAYIFFYGGEDSRPKIASVDIGSNVKSIGESAFYNCIASITIRSNVEYVGDCAFYGCTGLTEITISDSLKSIGSQAFSGCSNLSDVYYNGNRNTWNEISIGKYNEPLTKATKHYFVYVTLLDKNGNEISRKAQDLGYTLDMSMVTVPDDCLMVLYSDKEWTTVFDTNTPINENITIYAVVIKLNEIEIVGAKDINIDEKGISQKVTFLTDKEAKYFVCTLKYSKNLILNKITSEYFEIEQDSETVGEYNYLYLTCIYKGDGNLPVNMIQSPFELVFDISENVVANDILTVEILDDAILADDNGNSYTFSNIENAEIKINQILVTDITIAGADEVDSETNYTAFVLPQNATKKAVKWSVSDETIATISQDGTLTPIKTGSVTIKATAKDGSEVYAEKTVSVIVPVMVTSITILGIDEIENRSYDYMASVYPADADDKSVEWSVSDETIAAIRQDGRLLPIKTGIVTIRATAKDGSGVYAEKTVSVKVVKDVTNITILGADNIDSETTYAVSVLPEDADNKSVEWSVSDETIATISQDGILTPIKTGSVTIRAIAKDGSGVFAEKTVSVSVTATVTSITSNIGTWDIEYSPLHNDYIIYVPTSTTSIKLNAVHSGTLKSSDGKTFINNVAKTITLSSNQTVLTLSYKCDGYTDNTYTITVIKFDGTKTTVSDDGKTFTVNPINVEIGKKVILALYEGGKFVEMQYETYEGEAIPFTTTKAYTKAKVMVWDNLTNLKPVYDVEVVK